MVSGRQKNLEGAGGAEQQKGDGSTKNQHDDGIGQFENKRKGNQEKSCHGGGEENNEKAEEGYFARNRGKKMTIIFHAVLAPHFKFEKNQGDQIFMRFGGPAFGEFLDNVVEVHPER